MNVTINWSPGIVPHKPTAEDAGMTVYCCVMLWCILYTEQRVMMEFMLHLNMPWAYTYMHKQDRSQTNWYNARNCQIQIICPLVIIRYLIDPIKALENVIKHTTIHFALYLPCLMVYCYAVKPLVLTTPDNSTHPVSWRLLYLQTNWTQYDYIKTALRPLWYIVIWSCC